MQKTTQAGEAPTEDARIAHDCQNGTRRLCVRYDWRDPKNAQVRAYRNILAEEARGVLEKLTGGDVTEATMTERDDCIDIEGDRVEDLIPQESALWGALEFRRNGQPRSLGREESAKVLVRWAASGP